MNIDLNKGLSGCLLTLFDDRVNKRSHSISYNVRLEEQMEKQKRFSNFSIKGIKTPIVNKNGTDDFGFFYFDMEYIPGIQPIDFFISASKYDIDNFIYCLNNYIKFLFQSSKKYTSTEFKLNCDNKLKELYKISEYKDFINFLLIKNSKLGIDEYDKSFCHGDITLSNMIYFDNNIYLLDFLDSFVNSPIIDLVKLKQDLYYGWVLKNSEYVDVDFHRSYQVLRFIWRSIETSYGSYVTSDVFYLLESLNFLRIGPYILKDDMRLSLDKIIKSLKLYEEFNNADGGKVF